MNLQRVGLNTAIPAIQNKTQRKYGQQSYGIAFQGLSHISENPMPKKAVRSFFEKLFSVVKKMSPVRLESPFKFQFKTYEELTKGIEGKDFVVKQLKKDCKDVEILNSSGRVSSRYKYKGDKLICVMEMDGYGKQLKGYDLRKDGSMYAIRTYSKSTGKCTQGIYFDNSKISVTINSPGGVGLKSYTYTNKGMWEEYGPQGHKIQECEQIPEEIVHSFQ